MSESDRLYLGSLRPLAEYFDAFRVALDNVRHDESAKALDQDLKLFYHDVDRLKEHAFQEKFSVWNYSFFYFKQKLAQYNLVRQATLTSSEAESTSQDSEMSALPSSRLSSGVSSSDVAASPQSSSTNVSSILDESTPPPRAPQPRFSISNKATPLQLEARSFVQPPPSLHASALLKFFQLPTNVSDASVGDLARLSSEQMKDLESKLQKIRESIDADDLETVHRNERNRDHSLPTLQAAKDIHSHPSIQVLLASYYSVRQVQAKVVFAQHVKAEVDAVAARRHDMLGLSRFASSQTS